MRDRRYVGTMPFVAGWGHLAEKSKMSNVLQQVQIPLVRNFECKRNYEGAGLLATNTDEYSEDYVICAGFTEGGRDS